MRKLPLALLSLLLSGCFPFDDGDVKWASREQIIEAAARCGVPNFEPTKAGDAWAAYVPGEDLDKGPKSNCIYSDLKRQGLVATR